MFRYAALLLLFALTSAPGTVLWEVGPGGRDFGGLFAFAPTLAGSSGAFAVFDASKGSSLAAYDLKTGKEFWTTPSQGHLSGQSLTPSSTPAASTS